MGGVKAYGIDYRIVQQPNGQIYFPLFMVTSITKSLDSVSVECMQLHRNGTYDDGGWYDEVLFYFPDADPVVILDEDVEQFAVTPPVITDLFGNPLQNINFDTGEGNVDVYIPGAIAIDGDQNQSNIISSLTIITSFGEEYDAYDAEFGYDPIEGYSNEIFIGNFGVDAFQHWAIYSVTSPVTGLTAEETITININVQAAPSLEISPITGNFILNQTNLQHILQLEDVEGIDYREKYVYNTSPDQQINYSATDNETGEDLTNSVVFGTTGDLSTMIEGGTPPSPNIYNEAESYFMLGSASTTFLFSIWAVVIDNAGTHTNKRWQVAIQRPEDFYINDGDVNFDGALNILDVVTMVNFITGSLTPTDEQLIASDISGDGGLNILDLVQAVNIIMDNQ